MTAQTTPTVTEETVVTSDDDYSVDWYTVQRTEYHGHTNEHIGPSFWIDRRDIVGHAAVHTYDGDEGITVYIPTEDMRKVLHRAAKLYGYRLVPQTED